MVLKCCCHSDLDIPGILLFISYYVLYLVSTFQKIITLNQYFHSRVSRLLLSVGVKVFIFPIYFILYFYYNVLLKHLNTVFL